MYVAIHATPLLLYTTYKAPCTTNSVRTKYIQPPPCIYHKQPCMITTTHMYSTSCNTLYSGISMYISKCTSILVVQGKHLKHTLQWVMITTSASGVFTQVDERKTIYNSASCRGSRPSSVQVGTACSNNIRSLNTKARSGLNGCALNCARCIYLVVASCSYIYTCVQDGLDPLQLIPCWWCTPFFHLSARKL